MSEHTAGWNKIIGSLPGAHFLQTVEWADVKTTVGWIRHELLWRAEDNRITGAAQVLIRSMRLFGFGPRVSVGYIPRGPLIDWQDSAQRAQVLDALESFARKHKLVFIKIDPEVQKDSDTGESESNEIKTGNTLMKVLEERGWRFSPEQIQFRNTMLLDLTGTEEDWLARMKQKTRYNIRLAARNGVTVRKATNEDFHMLYAMYAETANRDGFIIRPEEYYLDVWSRFKNAGMAEGLIAEFEGQPLAGLVYFYLGTRAWYVYGMSRNLYREKMPNYLLQWEAMKAAKAKGCQVYDLWGAPDIITETDPMYGVYRFKEGLGAQLLCTNGAWDYPNNSFLYFTYHQVIPRVLNVMRFIRRRQIKQESL
jgi:peptidoglycan pentaglycine glycine transferase (the first glycine)